MNPKGQTMKLKQLLRQRIILEIDSILFATRFTRVSRKTFVSKLLV